MEEVKNEGPKEMTLDEWKAMQDKERTKVEFNIRKPNEGADSQWKKGYVLHKSKSEDVSMGGLDMFSLFLTDTTPALCRLMFQLRHIHITVTNIHITISKITF